MSIGHEIPGDIGKALKLVLTVVATLVAARIVKAKRSR